jgi:septum formation protein
MPDLILGSASPRRAQLLAQLGVTFECSAADIDETPRGDEDPKVYVRRMAVEKARALGAGAVPLLTADTTVIADGQSLGKPADRAEARAILERLSGAKHEVCTAVCLLTPDKEQDLLVTTVVEFAHLSHHLIDAYLDTPEPWDKAGAYAIQGLAGSFVRRIDGSVSNVIGLPLLETRNLLESAGITTGFGELAA